MKKLLFTAVSAIALCAMATDTPNVGVMAITSGAKRTLVAVPWVGSDGSSIPVADLFLTSNLTAGDTLHVSVNGVKVSEWTLTADQSGTLYWKAPDNVVDNDNVSDGDPADKTKIDRGYAAVLIRTGDLSKPFCVMGQIANSSPSVAILSGTSGNPAYTMIAPPSVKAQKINGDVNGGGTWTGNIAAADRIYVPLANGWNQELKWDTTTSKWQIKENYVDERGRKKTRWVASTAEIPMGTGFWYASQGGSPTVTWTDLPTVSASAD